jgi:outer membrane cobalamin receptor
VVRFVPVFKQIPQIYFLVVLFITTGTVEIRAQLLRGELQLEVHDPQGALLAPAAELVSQANQVRLLFEVGRDGRYLARGLPFGTYRLRLAAQGFSSWSGFVEIPSEVRVHLTAIMGMAPVATQVLVNDAATLLDPSRTGALYPIGTQPIAEELAGQPGRTLSDLVEELPGWLYEANGVLHPRGSEYDVQYVVDGLPITENRSPSFAAGFDADDVDSMRVLTAAYPAEYGRKLGGVVEVTTEKNAPAGLHAQFDINGGSFATVDSSAGVSLVREADRFTASGNGFHTERYLDPPVLANYTNLANADGYTVSYEHDFSETDRLRISLNHDAVRFLAPNELIQQEAGQRQDLGDSETAGQIYFQHTFSPDLLASFSGSVRDSAANLSSNTLSTPVIVGQDRGYREGYIRGDLAGHHGRHNWKAGVDSIFSPVHERLQYSITDPAQFDSGTERQFKFSDRRWDVEPSTYLQDQIRLGNWNVSAGLRFDHYGFVANESAWSPRLGVSRYLSSLGLLLHASYDRIFQTPAMENLLLASSPQVDSVSPVVVRLPVLPARGNYYEAGFTKALFARMRLDVNIFRRDFQNYSDDDVLLDTGVSFPIAFAKARIAGEEVRLDIPRWGRFSGYLSYANQSGIGWGPITGGLFLGSSAAGVSDTSKFAVSQDQRNTFSARLRLQAQKRIWLAFGGQYGSGLPADTNGADPNFLLAQYGAAILDRVNLEAGRVRSNFSLEAAAGFEIYNKEQRSALLQFQVANLTDRINVLNFASLFSGTAVSTPRSVSVRLRLGF